MSMALSALVSILYGRKSKTMSIQLSPDKEFVHEMRKKIKDNNGYCPCGKWKAVLAIVVFTLKSMMG